MTEFFERWWPDLKRNLAEAAAIPVSALPQRSDRELIEEMVNLVRGLQQQSLGTPQTASDILRFADYPDDSLRPQLRAAKDIALSGLNLSRFLTLFIEDIENAIANGARVRVAPYSIVVLRSDDPKIDPYCHARLLPFRRTSLRAPLIVPDPHINAPWFEFFESQFELQWNLATPPKMSD